MMNLYCDILSIDSTSGRESELGQWLYEHLEAPSKQIMEVGDGSVNLLLSWGEARVVYCTHIDTVPPYIAPSFKDGVAYGRGTCDAKGQIVAMYEACKRLEAMGRTGFALLLLSGEETGSWGAKAMEKTGFGAEVLVVGEPTDNYPASAAKGTKSYDLKFKGRAFHSGYPQYGKSAVELFVDFMNTLRQTQFPVDEILGDTTYNVGLLSSNNPQNILSPELECRLYWRTTLASDGLVESWMLAQASDCLEVVARGGDTPARYYVPEGMTGRPIAFGSDAPQLSRFERKIICGPGSISCAHRDDECLSLSELERAIDIYVDIFEK